MLGTTIDWKNTTKGQRRKGNGWWSIDYIIKGPLPIAVLVISSGLGIYMEGHCQKGDGQWPMQTLLLFVFVIK